MPVKGLLQNAKPCHSEPVTDVTDVGAEIRIYLQRKTDCRDQFANWSRNDSACCSKPLWAWLQTAPGLPSMRNMFFL